MMRGVVLILVALSASAVAPRFEPVQQPSMIVAGTLVNAFADYDGDGDPDMFVGSAGTANRLYRNDNGTFTDVAADVGLADARPTRGAAWGDFDADGDPDLLVGFAPGAGSVLRLLRNDRGKFSDMTTQAALVVSAGAVRQPAWLDVDGDGDLDLFVAFRDRADALFRNDKGTFTDIAHAVGLADARKSVGAVWFDFDEDGDLDAYVAHMDGDANALYRNEGARFVDVAEGAALAWGGRAPGARDNGTVRPCAADVNGDGRFDLFAANYGPNGLFLNQGGGRFDDVSAAWGIALDSRYDTCAFADFDHDGHLDLYVNGTVTGGTSYRDYLFRNTGAAFEDVTPDGVRELQADHGAQWVDIDLDGDADLALTGAGQEPMPLLFRNLLASADAARAVHVRVVDDRRHATRAGAEVRIYSAGTRRLLGTRLVDTGSGYDAQNDTPVHVGVPSGSRVDIEVTFPARGRRIVSSKRNVDPGASRRPIVIAVGR
jgi:hypothetical protein